MRKVIPFVFAVFIVSCNVQQKLLLKKNTKIENLSVCVNYSHRVPEEVKLKFNETTADFITKYNNNKKYQLKLSNCKDSLNNAIHFNIEETKLVTPKQQIWSSVANVVGLSLPVAMVAANASFFLVFWYIPQDISYIKLKLSHDLKRDENMVDRRIQNSGYFSSKRRQIKRQGRRFKQLLGAEIYNLKTQSNKTMNK